MPISQIRSPNQGERPVDSRSKKAKRALERSNIGLFYSEKPVAAKTYCDAYHSAS
jgi:hypothetical protein